METQNNIRMKYALLYGIGLFACCWLIHLIFWRINRPKGYLVWLPLVFFALPAVVATTGIALGWIAWNPAGLAQTWLAPIALHVLLTGCYICGYAGLTEYSPSAEILMVVRDAMPQGIEPEKMKVRSFTEYSLTGKRIEDLIVSGMAEVKQGRVRLTPGGRVSFEMCRLYRRIMAVDETSDG